VKVETSYRLPTASYRLPATGSRIVSWVALVVTLAAPVAAEVSVERFEALVADTAPRAVEWRHHLHQNPELSNRETETAAYVARHLEAMGLEVETGIAHTGVLGVLRGDQPGPTVAVRADIDALPVTEASGLPFASTRRTEYEGREVGVAHACGHDVHTAVVLGLAEVLAGARAELPGTVLFVFQPAEEGVPAGERGGARLMMEEGIFAGRQPTAIYALHSWPSRDVGQVEAAPGPTWAAVDRFRVVLHGRQAHGAYPDQGIDPVVMAAQAVTGLQTIRSRNLDPRAASVVTVGMIHGGERFNIIPGEVRLEGTVRTYRPDVQDRIEVRMEEILAGVAAAAGGRHELEYERITPATVNDEALHRAARATLEATLGPANVLSAEPTMAGEDFAYFTAAVPGYYFRLGVRAPGGESGTLHTPTFRADDGAVEVGMRALGRVILDALQAP
jgi:amidohydrolase